MLSVLSRLRPDNFTLALMGMVGLSAMLPIQGQPAHWFANATNGAIALLFFLHGARLSRQSVLAGMIHWRLHLAVLTTTYGLFPLMGLAMLVLPAGMIPSDMLMGLLFLCCLPSTVQSSIAFTAMAGGNVPAAICSASASNVLGVFLTPLLVGLLMQAQGVQVGLEAIQTIILQLLLPFMIGQLVHPWLGEWALRHKKMLSLVDRGSILMVVYGAFSEAQAHGLWTSLPPVSLLILAVISAILLLIVLLYTHWTGRLFGFDQPDRITILFCGSKKSLASGVPIANVLFSGPAVGMIVLPIMLFHQMQLMVCAVLAKRLGESEQSPHKAE